MFIVFYGTGANQLGCFSSFSEAVAFVATSPFKEIQIVEV